MKKTLLLIIIFFFLFLFPVSAQQRRADPWWITLEEGKRHFRAGAYGDALRYFEEARESRKNYYAKKERDLITVLSLHPVRRLGDDLALLERYIEREFRVDAADALKELYYRIPKSKLGNSSNTALRELGRLKNYPEADYWLGEVYRVEGEFSIALSQYRKAYEERALLENPEFGIEIMYKMAELRRLRREYGEMIKTLDDILKTDTLWSRESFDKANMLRSLGSVGVSRFLVLFRHNEPVVEKAHRTLGFYYYTNGQHEKSVENLLFAFLIQNSVIIDALVQSKYDYTFTSLSGLINDISRRRDLLAYIDEIEYYKTIYYLANSLFGVNRRAPARELWTFLRDNAPGEWRGRALSQLNNPQFDPIPEAIGRTPAH